MINAYNNSENNEFGGMYVAIDRKSVLARIVKEGDWAPADDTRNYEKIKENLIFLTSVLELDYLDHKVLELEMMLKANRTNEDDYNKLSGELTSRQISCMSEFNRNVQNGNVQGAFHELYNFIEGYRGGLYDKHINIIEKVTIRSLIFQIYNMFKINKSRSEVFNLLEKLKNCSGEEADLIIKIMDKLNGI